MPVPPLQWIELTDLLNGASAPPLKDATIGYDSTTRVLLIFGGESQQGFPTSQTYTYVSSLHPRGNSWIAQVCLSKVGLEDTTMVDSQPAVGTQPSSLSKICSH